MAESIDPEQLRRIARKLKAHYLSGLALFGTFQAGLILLELYELSLEANGKRTYTNAGSLAAAVGLHREAGRRLIRQLADRDMVSCEKEGRQLKVWMTKHQAAEIGQVLTRWL